MTQSKQNVAVLYVVGFFILVVGGFGIYTIFFEPGAGISSDTGEARTREVAHALSSLEVEGPRTRANIISNLDPMLRKMQEIYRDHRTRKPDLAGSMTFKMTIEGNGEIGFTKIVRNTFDDKEFEIAVMGPFQFMDFDGWIMAREDTDIEFSVAFDG